MNVQFRNVHLSRIAWLGLVGAAALLSTASLASLVSRPSASRELLDLVAEVRAPQERGTEGAAAPTARPRRGRGTGESSQTVEQITQRNMFSPPAGPKKPPIPLGVLGDEAVFPNNEWVKVGEEYQGLKLLAIGPDWVEFEIDGKPARASVFAPREGEQPPAAAASATPPEAAGPGGVGRRGRFFGGPRGFVVTPDMIERFRSMPPDVRERWLERMPPEIRQQLEQ
jgi:hypothetical protein